MSFCTIRDGLPGSPPGTRRPCLSCEALERPRRATISDPGPGTLSELVHGTVGIHAELRELTRRIERARDLSQEWGESPEGQHARQWLAMLRLELRHEEERLHVWRRRLAHHPELGPLSVKANCSCVPRNACLRVDWTPPEKAVDVANYQETERVVGEDDGDF